MEELDYIKDVKIDESALDVEWLEQTTLLVKYARNAAKWHKRVMQAEEKIKVVRAELIEEANQFPDRCLGKGIKPTAPNIESYYRNHEDHKAAKEEWITATFEYDIALAAKDAISFSRKAALENLVILHGQQYFAGPRVPRNLSEEREMRAKKVDEGIANGLNKRIRRS
jgi:hypothetical protein